MKGLKKMLQYLTGSTQLDETQVLNKVVNIKHDAKFYFDD